MRRHVHYSKTLENDGPEIEFEYEPIDGTLLETKVADKYVVAYLVYDSDPLNPLKEWDCNGELITYHEGVITDGDPWTHLGLHSRGEKDFELDGVEELVEKKLKALITANEALRVWYVKLRLELDCEPIQDILNLVRGYYCGVDWSEEDRERVCDLPSYETLAEEAWDELYAEGKTGTYLAVPVKYLDNCHGPGTTRIYTCDIVDANAVWVPDQGCIDNMNFTSCTSYLEKYAVADKYAQSVLDEYEKWCNSEVYGCVVQVHEEDGELVEADSCWGFIGYEYAEEALKEEFFEPTCKRVQKEYDEDVHTKCGMQVEMTL